VRQGRGLGGEGRDAAVRGGGADREAVGGRHQPHPGALERAERAGAWSVPRQRKAGVTDGWDPQHSTGDG
jgi:hypothetical protein